jgi:hypothetical protein
MSVRAVSCCTPHYLLEANHAFEIDPEKYHSGAMDRAGIAAGAPDLLTDVWQSGLLLAALDVRTGEMILRIGLGRAGCSTPARRPAAVPESRRRSMNFTTLCAAVRWQRCRPPDTLDFRSGTAAGKARLHCYHGHRPFAQRPSASPARSRRCQLHRRALPHHHRPAAWVLRFAAAVLAKDCTGGTRRRPLAAGAKPPPGEGSHRRLAEGGSNRCPRRVGPRHMWTVHHSRQRWWLPVDTTSDRLPITASGFASGRRRVRSGTETHVGIARNRRRRSPGSSRLQALSNAAMTSQLRCATVS